VVQSVPTMPLEEKAFAEPTSAPIAQADLSSVPKSGTGITLSKEWEILADPVPVVEGMEIPKTSDEAALARSEPLGVLAKPRADFRLDGVHSQNWEDPSLQAKAATLYRAASGLFRAAANQSQDSAIGKQSGFSDPAEGLVQRRRPNSDSSGELFPIGLFSAADVAMKNQAAQNTALETSAPSASTPVSEVFRKVESMALQGGGRVTVAIDPPDLGKVEIQVTTRGKRVEIAMTSENDRAKSVLEAGLGHLKQALESQDLTLTRTEVRAAGNGFPSLATGDFSNGGRFFARQDGGKQSESGRALSGARPLVQTASVNAPRRLSADVGRVDLRI